MSLLTRKHQEYPSGFGNDREVLLDTLSVAAQENRDEACDEPATRLTPMQMKILSGVQLGLLNKQIAYDLGIAEATVKAHMTALMRKLNVRNRTQVALAARAIILKDSQTTAR